MEYISREDVIRQICLTTGCSYYGEVVRTIMGFPSADVQPVKHGEWEYSEKENGECGWYFCSECDEPAEQLYDDSPLLSKFCPRCGADMRGEKNENSS